MFLDLEIVWILIMSGKFLFLITQRLVLSVIPKLSGSKYKWILWKFWLSKNPILRIRFTFEKSFTLKLIKWTEIYAIFLLSKQKKREKS